MGSISFQEYLDVLTNKNTSVRVKNSGNGILVFSDNTVIKCVKNYFANPNIPYTKTNCKSCYDTMQTLGRAGIAVNQCHMCHLSCARAFESKELYRKL
jgi:cbb3-type cytochrome oxidase cytochrome c subunit